MPLAHPLAWLVDETPATMEETPGDHCEQPFPPSMIRHRVVWCWSYLL
jgi:hypothetical protein